MKVILSICFMSLYNNAFTTSQLFTSLLKHNPLPPNVSGRRLSEIPSGVFTQKLDHFDPNNTQTWSQRFFVNTEFFNNTGNNVAFLMLGGEILFGAPGAASDSWMTQGLWIDSAKKYGAILFLLEHRFYGESQPFSDWSTENLRFLSSQQTLADAAEFIKAMNEQYSLGSNVKWISFGGSYSGSLSAWLRLKYPDTVYAAVASSAPLRAEVDQSGFYQVVVDDLKNINEECVANLKKGMAQVDNLLADPNSSDETVTSIFNLCDPIEKFDLDDISIDNFYTIIAISFSVEASFNGILGINLQDVCAILNDDSRGSQIHRIADFVKGSDSECLEYVPDIDSVKNTTITDYTFRQWDYQRCTEFGWFASTNREDRVFGRGVSVDFFLKICSDIFGPDFNSTFIYNQIDKTNADYHATDINATRIVFTQGSLDPGKSVGLLKANNADSPVIYIEGASNCNDMYDNFRIELPQVVEAREEVSKIIGEWLGYN